MEWTAKLYELGRSKYLLKHAKSGRGFPASVVYVNMYTEISFI